MLSRFPTDGPTLDEDALEENLVGFPTSNIVVGSREPEQIYHIHPNSSNSSPISLQTLIDWQGEDPKIQEIVSNFTSDSPACNTRLNRLEKFDNLIYEEGLLKKRKVGNISDNTMKYMVVVPVDKQEHILWRYHDHVLAGHPGWKETYRAITNRFYWKSVRESTRRYVAACHICECTKPLDNKIDVPLRPRKPTQQWEVVSVDLMGPYARTSRGKTNILVATDCHSRWVEAYPLGAATSAVIIQTLERELFARFGYPRVLLSDNIPQFTSDVWTKALDRWGVEGWTTPVYHPRANPVERRNQELKKGLRALLVNDSHRSWDQKLSAVLFTFYRKNDRTGVSPSVSVFGHKTKSPGDWALIVKSDSTPRVPATLDIITVAEKSKENQRAFAAGDQVFVKAHPLSKADQGFHARAAPASPPAPTDRRPIPGPVRHTQRTVRKATKAPTAKPQPRPTRAAQGPALASALPPVHRRPSQQQRRRLPTVQPRPQPATAQPRAQPPIARPRTQPPTVRPRTQPTAVQPRAQPPNAPPRTQPPPPAPIPERQPETPVDAIPREGTPSVDEDACQAPPPTVVSHEPMEVGGDDIFVDIEALYQE
ncbi:uncharacterized protein LOC126551119 [Aphis gossypii]|uniref:uncharacterized protein LOC126551119 n=1 Tax=Aphis gossypii TaxID=80765 RepID=UPI002158EEA2|nr:uncharacterized protein LOC126551119 [Aphis gossypii]